MSEEKPPNPAETQAIVVATPPLTDEQVQLAVLRQDFMALTAEQRDYVRLWICKQKGYDPLTNAIMYIPDGKGGLRLYAGQAAAKTEKDKLKATVAPVYMGPLRSMTWAPDGSLQLGDVVDPQLYVTIWKATSEGMGDTYDGSALALVPEKMGLENAFKKLLTQGTNRTIFRHAGNPFMDASEAGDMDKGFAPASQPSGPAQPQRKPAQPKPVAEVPPMPVKVSAAPAGKVVEAEIVETPMGPAKATGEGLMEGVVLEPSGALDQDVARQPQRAQTASSTIRVVKQDATQAQPAPPSAPLPPRGIAQTAPAPSAPAGPRPLPRSPLPAARPPQVPPQGGKR